MPPASVKVFLAAEGVGRYAWGGDFPGMVRGRVLDGSGGFTVQARDENDDAVGDVRYGANGDNGRPSDVRTSR